MRRRLAAACAVMMIAVMAMGCAGKTPAASTDGNDTETSVQEEEPAEEEPAELSEEEEQELYNLYIGLNNTMVGRLSSSLSKYFEYVDFQEEFTLLNGEDYFCYSLESTLDELDHI
ncbi:MAG: YiiG family protein, partial [Lachnospiraceae bacterium]|nr:YiiG family protein [Lachnospiraceae bacterium]